jgi:hypothetical protein
MAFTREMSAGSFPRGDTSCSVAILCDAIALGA